MNVLYYFTLVSVIIFSLESIAIERKYFSHIESADWKTEVKEQNYCLLKQKIPYYGEVMFSRKSGRDILFELTSQELVLKETDIVIMAEPAPWRSNIQSFEIGSFKLTKGHKPLTVHSPYASRMFQHLENGMMPTITYRDSADQRDLITIAISPMHFRKYLGKFRQCESTLLEYNPEFIQDFEIFFATNKAILSTTAKNNLAYVVKHLEIKPDIKQIRVDAYTDNVGRRRYNDKLSEKRADAVRNYLIKIGADNKMININSHGERNPQHSNATKRGRSKNRYARIQMLTTPPPIEKVTKTSDKKELKSGQGVTPPVPNFINLEHLITR